MQLTFRLEQRKEDAAVERFPGISWITAVYASAVLFGSLLWCAPASADQQLDLYGTLQHFTWREFDDNGSQLVREAGPLLGVGVHYRIKDEGSRLRPSFKGDLFGGQVEYTGQACTLAGTCAPSSSDTTYFGFQGQGDLGVVIPSGSNGEVIPFAGIGFRWWLRDIGDSMTALGPARGYEEFWTSYFLRLGMRGENQWARTKHMSDDTSMPTAKHRVTLFAEVAVRIPVYTENTIPDFDITLHPRGEPSLCAEMGVRGERLLARAFYETLRFKKSSDEVQGTVRYWQPASEADIYGLSVGVAF